MLALRSLRLSNGLKRSICKLQKISVNVKYCSNKSDDDRGDPKDDTNQPKLGDMASKYKTFKEQDSETVYDIFEERLKYSEAIEKEEAEILDPFEGINLQRGQTGVFDIEDLIDVLKRENAQDIFVVAVPPNINYVDYICIITGKSNKHMKALAQFVRRVYKQKRNEHDLIPLVEGPNSKDWMAIDLGNIALHIFSKEARAIYDIDSLWAVGSKYDKEYNKEDPIVDMLERHSIYLGGLKPAS